MILNRSGTAMVTTRIQPRHDLSAIEIGTIEQSLYDFNRGATGRNDARGLGFVIRDDTESALGVVSGHSWADTAEIEQMFVEEAHRGRGHARKLLDAFVAEAVNRGVRRIWVASHDFQAPGMYEKAGFKRMAEFAGWPEGHSKVILCKTLIAP
jgi:ribosomal protein S18 acetylase RimI-like enzyme